MTYDAAKVRRAVTGMQAPASSLDVVRKALGALEDDQRGNTHLEQILMADPGVSARVLRLANSAFFGVSRYVSTVSIAIAIIGHQQLRLLLRHVLVSEVFDTIDARRPEGMLVWKASVAAGAASYVISRSCRVGDPEELLTVGLLHRVGEFALLLKFPDQYSAVQRIAGGQLSTEGLRVVFGIGAGEVGQWLLDSWNFPALFGKAATLWPTPLSKDVPEDLQPRLCVIHAAVSVACAWLEELDEERAYARISPEVVAALDLQEEVLHKLYGQLAHDVGEIESLLQA